MKNGILEILTFLNTYSDGITALSVAIATILAISGVNAWKKQLKGKTDYEIARQYLKAILQLRDAMKYVRNPFIPIGEMQTALKEQGFDPEDNRDDKKVNRSVYSVRWNKVQEAWINFETLLLEAQISWGMEAVNIQENFDGLVKKLRSVIWLFINNPESFHKRGEENDKLLYGTYNQNDDFSVEVDREIEKIRDYLKRYL